MTLTRSMSWWRKRARAEPDVDFTIGAPGGPRVLLESSDAARILGLSYSGVRVLVERGKLKPYAVTPRGVKLFDVGDVNRLRYERAVAAGRIPHVEGKDEHMAWKDRTGTRCTVTECELNRQALDTKQKTGADSARGGQEKQAVPNGTQDGTANGADGNGPERG